MTATGLSTEEFVKFMRFISGSESEETIGEADIPIGTYVIARCHDAGVHAGILVSHAGRECVLDESRRLWYWRPANNAAFLSGVATEGLHRDSKIGAPIRIILTEVCEIIECNSVAMKSIKGAPNHEPG